MRENCGCMHQLRQKGFTLIELMFVVTIIGILSAFAVPLFQDYIKRVRVGEALQFASVAKSAITEGFASNGVWFNGGSGANAVDANAAVGLPPPSEFTSGAMKSLHIVGLDDATGDGVRVVITFNSKVIDGGQIFLEAVQHGSFISIKTMEWRCGSVAGTGMEESWLPANCRGNIGYI